MKVAINTGGGDAPGLNSVIRSATLAGIVRGWTMVGVRDGYDGLLFPERYDGDGVVELDRQSVRGIAHLGGTMLGTTNRGNPFRQKVRHADGSVSEVNRGGELVEVMRHHGIDAVIAAGGDGSLSIAYQLSRLGMPVVGVPKTIDNDLEHTNETFGFDSAISFATECLDRMFATAQAHSRIIVVEVMGRSAGWIALYAGVASAVHAVLIPEIPFNLELVADALSERYARGSEYAIVVVAEGAAPLGGEVTTVEGNRLGGIGLSVAAQLSEMTGIETRSLNLGHLLRGGSPTARDRILGHRCGAAAVRAIEQGTYNVMVSMDGDAVRLVPLAEVSGRVRQVPLDNDVLTAARDIGICLGD